MRCHWGCWWGLHGVSMGCFRGVHGVSLGVFLGCPWGVLGVFLGCFLGCFGAVSSLTSLSPLPQLRVPGHHLREQGELRGGAGGRVAPMGAPLPPTLAINPPRGWGRRGVGPHPPPTHGCSWGKCGSGGTRGCCLKRYGVWGHPWVFLYGVWGHPWVLP